MNIWDSPVYRNDIMSAISLVDIEAIKEKSILITGATGLICSTIVDILIACNKQHNLGVKIYAAGRNVSKVQKRFPHGIGNGLFAVEYDATKENIFDFHSDFIIHGAGNASPEKYISEPVDTMLANINGVNELLKYSVNTKSKKVVYISSSEVYGKLYHGKPFTENEYGEVDILSVRSSYPMGKRAAETICVSYAKQYNVDVSIVRPGHIYGPTAQQSDNRVSSLFVRQAAAGENLVMKSEGTQVRSYCHCVDCATAILCVLTRGKPMQAYNISNKASVITIRQMAEYVSKCADVKLVLDIPSDAEKTAFNPMDNSSLNSEKLESLGWYGQFDAQTGFEHAVKALKELA